MQATDKGFDSLGLNHQRLDFVLRELLLRRQNFLGFVLVTGIADLAAKNYEFDVK